MQQQLCLLVVIFGMQLEDGLSKARSVLSYALRKRNGDDGAVEEEDEEERGNCNLGRRETYA